MKTSPVISAANALLDLTLDSLAVEVRFVPGNFAEGRCETDVFAGAAGAGRVAGAIAFDGTRKRWISRVNICGCGCRWRN